MIGPNETLVFVSTSSPSADGRDGRRIFRWSARRPLPSDAMLKLVLPKGSLEKATLELFEAADLRGPPRLGGRLQGHHRRPADRRGPHPAARRRSRRTSPRGCSTSASPAGTGSRRPPATSCRSASCSTRRPRANPVRIVVAVPATRPYEQVDDLPAGRAGLDRVPRAHPALLRRRRASRPTSACPTAPPRPRCPTSSTASSTSPRPAGPCGPPASRSSTRSCSRYTELIANPAAYADPDKRHAMDQIRTLLEGVLEARGKVLVKLNVRPSRPRRGDRPAAVDEVADGQRALRRRRLRGRDGGAQARASTC